MDRQTHWEIIHREKAADGVSWYRPHLDMSLRLIEELAPDNATSILDVGAGQSALVDDLLERGYRDITVLDIAQVAIDSNLRRLGTRGDQVRWLAGDVTTIELERAAYDLWHDRAVFHFLTGADDRAAYVRQAARTLQPGGHVVIATFDAASLGQEFGEAFRLVKALDEDHRTPTGKVQPFLYCCLTRQHYGADSTL